MPFSLRAFNFSLSFFLSRYSYEAKMKKKIKMKNAIHDDSNRNFLYAYLLLLCTEFAIKILLTHFIEVVVDFLDMLFGGVIKSDSWNLFERYLSIVINALDFTTIPATNTSLSRNEKKIDVKVPFG